MRCWFISVHQSGLLSILNSKDTEGHDQCLRGCASIPTVWQHTSTPMLSSSYSSHLNAVKSTVKSTPCSSPEGPNLLLDPLFWQWHWHCNRKAAKSTRLGPILLDSHSASVSVSRAEEESNLWKIQNVIIDRAGPTNLDRDQAFLHLPNPITWVQIKLSISKVAVLPVIWRDGHWGGWNRQLAAFLVHCLGRWQ